jgi:hypothetical protein
MNLTSFFHFVQVFEEKSAKKSEDVSVRNQWYWVGKKFLSFFFKFSFYFFSFKHQTSFQ